MRVGPRKIVNGRKLLVAENGLFLEGRFKHVADTNMILNHLRFKAGEQNYDSFGCIGFLFFIGLGLVIFTFVMWYVIVINAVNNYKEEAIFYLVCTPFVSVMFAWYMIRMLKEVKILLCYPQKTRQYKEILMSAIKMRQITVGKIKSVDLGEIPSFSQHRGLNNYYFIHYVALIDQAIIPDVFIVKCAYTEIYDLKRGDKVYVLYYGAHRFLL